MTPIYTECIISMSRADETGAGTVYDCEAVVIRVIDDAAGPYLRITGRSDEAVADGGVSSFTLGSDAEIVAFARICKRMLLQAEIAIKY